MPKFRVYSCLIFLFFFFCRIPFAHAEVVDKILVIVNDEIITQGEIDRILLPIYRQYKDLYSAEELITKIDEARRGVLQKLIQDKLLLTEAKRRKIEVENKEVEAKMEELKGRFLNEEEFKQTLKREKILIGEIKKKHRERIMIDKLVDMEIRRRVSIAPNEVFIYYKSHKEQFKEPRMIKLRSILIKVQEGRSEGGALKSAKEILSRLKEGGSFALLAQEYSDGPYREAGGDMGWVKDGELMNRINNLVFGLEENQISGILKTKLGFHIFKVEEKKPARTGEFREVKDRVEKILFNKKVEKELSQWLAELKEDAYIAFR